MKFNILKKQTKIFLILSDCIDGYGGIAEYNRNLLKAMSQNDTFFIHCFVRKGKKVKHVSENYIQYKAVKNKYLFSLLVIYKAIFIRPKIVFNGHLFTIRLSSLISRISSAVIVNQFHGTEIWDNILTNDVVKILNKSHCLSVSNYTDNNLYKINNISSTVIPNTFNSKFTYLNQKDKLRNDLKINQNDTVLMTVARLDSRNNGYKGQEDIIDFIYQNKIKSNINYKYLIIGKGELEEHLKKKVIELNLEDHVFILGYVDDDDLIKYYNSADLFIMLSRGEGFGIVYLEAMSCGLPAIGFDSGGVKDVLKYPFSKRISKTNELQLAINYLLHKNKFNKKTISKSIEKDFGFSVFSEKINIFFENLLN